MRAVKETSVRARGAEGRTCAVLRIALLPHAVSTGGPPPLIEADPNSDEDRESLAAVQLLEGHEYLYEWTSLTGPGAVRTDPQEAFQPDSGDGLKGRLRPGLSTGIMAIQLNRGETMLAQFDVEVRSRKLHYLSEYRWMLRDIADQMTELVMERFAASGMTFVPSATSDAVTLYQRFAFLRSLITSENFQNALNEILRRPHVAWSTLHEVVSPAQGVKADSYTVRQISGVGRRAPWPNGLVASIPAKLERKRTEATHDTPANRFVRFALERWRQVVADIDRGLARCDASPAVLRGRREVSSVIQLLGETLNQGIFKEIGPLTHFPADNQVLHRRNGYRDVFKAYLEFELAAQLSWKAAESSYSAGQRDVATLYEFWAFIQIAKLVAELSGQKFDMKPLIVRGEDGLSVALQSGKETLLTGEVKRFGRRLSLQLCFNRTFSVGSPAGSWTRPMRPDYSLFIRPAEVEATAFEPIVVHFDAKYRVNFTEELFGGGDELADAKQERVGDVRLKRGGVLRSDLLKMHAYRDAIRRSAGAYVIYPGDDDGSRKAEYKEYHELLPGLGAFALRPTGSGDAIGRAPLRKFLNDVFEHVATRLTRHERGRYWLEEVYGRYDVSSGEVEQTIVGEPLPETNVLLGYVKSAEHWRWIHKTRSYNVRTEERVGGVTSTTAVLYCQLLMLYCPELETIALARVVSSPERVDREAMKITGYPNPTSDYWCIQLSWLAAPDSIAGLRAASISAVVERMGKRKGEPASVTWLQLGEEVRANDRQSGLN